MKAINSIPGLQFKAILSDHLRAAILQMEESYNLAVKECLKKQRVLVLTHDSSFRKPLAPLVVADGNSFIFPPQPFPEFNATAIMASPSAKVHTFLIKACKLSLNKDDATLLVGTDSTIARV